MNKDFKSVLTSIFILLLYIYATAGIVKLFWNTKNTYAFEGRVKLIGLLLFILNILLVILPDHIARPENIDGVYMSIILFNLIYLTVGIFANLIIKNNNA